jgi:hypothetical protein
MEIDIFSLYKLCLSATTIYQTFLLVPKLLKYKKVYDKIPPFLRKYMLKNASEIVVKKIDETRNDLIFNLRLLGILLLLNVLLWFI